MSGSPRPAAEPVVVYAPDVPERSLLGDLPANVELVPVSLEDGPIPDLARADLVDPHGSDAGAAARSTGRAPDDSASSRH